MQPHSFTSLSPSPEAVEIAQRLVFGGQRGKREANVVADVAGLLSEVGVKSHDIEREFPAGGGRIDLYLPRYRVVIEVKAHGKAERTNDQAFALLIGQMEGYLTAEIRRELGGIWGPVSERADWLGILTDGRHWHIYSYPHAHAAASQRRLIRSVTVGDGPDLVRRISGWLDRSLVGRAWVPMEPSALFRGMREELVSLFRAMPADARRTTETKRSLWLDLLRVSGMRPSKTGDVDQLFVAHSLLIAIARLVTHLIARRSEPHEVALGEGFTSWLLDWRGGEERGLKGSGGS